MNVCSTLCVRNPRSSWSSRAVRPSRLLRLMMGATNPLQAVPGSIRGDYADDVTFNLIHGSDCPETAERRDRPLFRARRVGLLSRLTYCYANRHPRAPALVYRHKSRAFAIQSQFIQGRTETSVPSFDSTSKT